MRPSVPIFRLKRQARLLARRTAVPLHRALDEVALGEGYRSWSHLAASSSGRQPAAEILARLKPGELVLLAARPGQGKTLLGLALAVEAAKAGRPAFFFTLEDNEETVLARIRSSGTRPEALGRRLMLDASDAICADHVIERMGTTPRGAVAVIDYLQLLDQRRSNPELGDQVRALKAFAERTGSTILALSQIDRAFDLSGPRLPDRSHVRLPNPLDLTLFAGACFMHAGEVRLERPA